MRHEYGKTVTGVDLGVDLSQASSTLGELPTAGPNKRETGDY